jgi:hypothetical protein
MVARNHGRTVNIVSSKALNGNAFGSPIHLQQHLYLVSVSRLNCS